MVAEEKRAVAPDVAARENGASIQAKEATAIEGWQLSLPVEDVLISLIGICPVKVRRGLNHQKIAQLAETFENGAPLLHPVSLRPSPDRKTWELYAGEHRWEAAKKAGWQTIPATIDDIDDAEARRRSIEENVYRDDLSSTERDAQILELKRLHVAKHGESRRGGDQRSKTKARPPRFEKEFEAKSGKSVRAIEESIERALAREQASPQDGEVTEDSEPGAAVAGSATSQDAANPTEQQKNAKPVPPPGEADGGQPPPKPEPKPKKTRQRKVAGPPPSRVQLEEMTRRWVEKLGEYQGEPDEATARRCGRALRVLLKAFGPPPVPANRTGRRRRSSDQAAQDGARDATDEGTGVGEVADLGLAAKGRASPPERLGVHFALSEEDLKGVLGIRDPKALFEFLEDVAKRYDEGPYFIGSYNGWYAIHRFFTDGRLICGIGPSPLAYATLGGAPLMVGDDFWVSLVQPDQVREVSVALGRVTERSLRERYDKLDGTDRENPTDLLDFKSVRAYFRELRMFFKKAVAAGRSVLFKVTSE